MSTPSRFPATRRSAVDVTLVLEGTYPYVSGGVSSWVHQIVSGLPEVTFAILFIGGERGQHEKRRFDVPPNVVQVTETYLGEASKRTESHMRKGDARMIARSNELHDWFRQRERPFPQGLASELFHALLDTPGRHHDDFLYGEAAWHELRGRYLAHCEDLSFLDYFWTVRSMHAPLFHLAKALRGAPPTRAYHSVSTGFAGFTAAIFAQRAGRPFILTEHGIYTKERKIDLLQASWIQEAKSVARGPADDVGYLRGLWIRFFEGLGRVTYAYADPIIALFEGNRERQVTDGAARPRTRVVPNGIDLQRFAKIRARREGPPKPIVGLLGRVVPIKDVKTFVRAMRIVCSEMPDAEGWIIGPEDEDKGYALECHDLVKNLDLEGKVKFRGFQKPEAVLHQVSLLVLTSISEAQPLVLLEGFAAGVPCVASDVGCCRELVEGATPDDKALGHAGVITPIANPDATAQAIVALLRDEERWQKAQEAGVRRVETSYTLEKMIDTYRAIYQTATGTP